MAATRHLLKVRTCQQQYSRTAGSAGCSSKALAKFLHGLGCLACLHLPLRKVACITNRILLRAGPYLAEHPKAKRISRPSRSINPSSTPHPRLATPYPTTPSWRSRGCSKTPSQRSSTKHSPTLHHSSRWTRSRTAWTKHRGCSLCKAPSRRAAGSGQPPSREGRARAREIKKTRCLDQLMGIKGARWHF